MNKLEDEALEVVKLAVERLNKKGHYGLLRELEHRINSEYEYRRRVSADRPAEQRAAIWAEYQDCVMQMARSV